MFIVSQRAGAASSSAAIAVGIGLLVPGAWHESSEASAPLARRLAVASPRSLTRARPPSPIIPPSRSAEPTVRVAWRIRASPAVLHRDGLRRQPASRTSLPVVLPFVARRERRLGLLVARSAYAPPDRASPAAADLGQTSAFRRRRSAAAAVRPPEQGLAAAQKQLGVRTPTAPGRRHYAHTGFNLALSMPWSCR